MVFPPPRSSVGWGRSNQPSPNPSWRHKQSSGPALSTPRPSGCRYLPEILLQEGDTPVVPGLPGTVVGQAQQPGVELTAQGWPQALLVSLEHLQRGRGRAETQTTPVWSLGQDLGGQGLLPSSTHPIPSCWLTGRVTWVLSTPQSPHSHPAPCMGCCLGVSKTTYDHLEPLWI